MNNVKPSEIIILVSGVLLLVFSFLDWLGEGSFAVNGWDEFPLFTWPALFGAAAAIVVALEKFANTNLPDRVLGFTWPQLYLVAGLVALLITLGLVIAADDQQAGLYLSLLASIGLLVGAFMLHNETAGTGGAPSPGSTPPQPF